MTKSGKNAVCRMSLPMLAASLLLSGCAASGVSFDSTASPFTWNPTVISTEAVGTTDGAPEETAGDTTRGEEPGTTAPEPDTGTTEPGWDTSDLPSGTTDLPGEEETKPKKETTAKPIPEPEEYTDGDYTYHINVKSYLKYIAPANAEKYLLLTNRANPLPDAGKWTPGKKLEKLVQVYGSSAYLTETAAMAMKAMILEAEALGVYDSFPQSGYRSYALQEALYEKYKGEEAAAHPALSAAEVIALVDAYSARPGTSEHQTGLAMDFLPIDQSFSKTAFYRYLTGNAYRFGFILRYESTTEDITGYRYEPWHWRFVGREAATYIFEHQITLEEYLEERYPGRYEPMEGFYETSLLPPDPPPDTEPASTDEESDITGTDSDPGTPLPPETSRDDESVPDTVPAETAPQSRDADST